VSKTIEQLFLAEINPHKECNFVLAISGGLDSMVLANLFLINNLNFSIAHCNFQLRGKESDDDELFINKWCSEKDIKLYNKKFSTEDYCKNNKLTIQMGARELRYEWFRELIDKEKHDFIVTAHHIDDQLETFIINSIRGTGIDGLVGIPDKINKIIRPLLMSSKDQIKEYSKVNKINYREDSSNDKEDYLRNKIRHSVIPYLKSDDDNVLLKFKTTVENLNSTKIFVKKVISKVRDRVFIYEGENIITNIGLLKDLDPIEFYIHELYKDFEFNYKEVIKLFDSDSGKQISSANYNMTKQKNNLIISKIK
jgi:tRNA(Ile)-lysidine synthase